MVLSIFLPGCDQAKKEIDNVKLARFYLEQGNDKLALEVLGGELAKGANMLEAHSLLGAIFINAEYYNDAVRHYKAAIELGCGQVCTEGLIDAFLGQGEVELAEQEYLSRVPDKQSEGSKYRAILIDFYRNKKHQQAIDRLKLIELPAARDRIMALKYELGRYKEIARGYDKDASYSEDQLLIFAKASYVLKQYQQAEEILLTLNLKRSSRLLTGKKIQAVDLLVKVNLALNRIGDAELIYHNFLKNNEGTSFVTFQNAVTQLANKNFDAAIDEIGTLAKRNPENIEIAQILAVAHFGKKNYQAVIHQLEPFRARLNKQSLILLADAYNKTGRLQDSINLLKNVTQNDQVAITLSRAYLQKNEKLKALAVIKPVSVQTGNQSFNQKLAELWFDLDKFKEIISEFTGDTEHPLKIKYLVTRSYLKLKRIKAARQYAENETDPALSLELRGYLEAISGNLGAATKIYKELVRSKPVKKSYFLLASSHLENKKYAESLQSIKSGMDLDGDNRALLVLASRILLENDDAETYQWLDSIQDNSGDYRPVQTLLASYEIRRKNNDKAIKRLKPLMENADNQFLYLMAMAKRDSDTKESVQLLEQSLLQDFSLRVASLLHQFYLRGGDKANLERINGRIEQSGGINLRTANLLAKGYLALLQYDKSEALAGILERQGYPGIGKELTADGLAHQGKHSQAAEVYHRLLDTKFTEALLLKYFTSRITATSSTELPVVLKEAEFRLKKNPEMHALRNLVGTKYVDIDNLAAIRHLRILAGEFPNDSVVLNNLAWASLDLYPASALKYSEKAYRTHGDNDSILDTYIRALIKNNKSGKAKNILQSKLKDSPDNQNLQNLMQSLN